MDVLHYGDHMFRQWLSVLRLMAWPAAEADADQSRPASRRPLRLSLPRMSSDWLIEHEVAAAKHRNDD